MCVYVILSLNNRVKAYIFITYSQDIIKNFPVTLLRQFLTTSYRVLKLFLAVIRMKFGHDKSTPNWLNFEFLSDSLIVGNRLNIVLRGKKVTQTDDWLFVF